MCCLRHSPVRRPKALMHAVIHTFMHNRMLALLHATPVFCVRNATTAVLSKVSSVRTRLADMDAKHECEVIVKVSSARTRPEDRGMGTGRSGGAAPEKEQKRRTTGVFLWITATKHCESARSYSHNRLANVCINAVKAVLGSAHADVFCKESTAFSRHKRSLTNANYRRSSLPARQQRATKKSDSSSFPQPLAHGTVEP